MTKMNYVESEVVKTDVIIIGAGPVGLFAVFELGLLGLNSVVIDILNKPGGQCAELYPEKPILDIPSRLRVTGQELTNQLMQQIEPFSPIMFFNQMVTELEKISNSQWCLKTDQGLVVQAPVVCIAGGGGSFTPKRLKIDGLESYENKSLFYAVKKIEEFESKNIVIAGGGDSALDWVIALNDKVNSMHLVHRRSEFRAVQDSINKMRNLETQGKLTVHIGDLSNFNGVGGVLESVVIKNKKEGTSYNIKCSKVIAFHGLTIKLGPISEWGINMSKNRIIVDTEKFETSEPGIFCIGDMCSYPGKLKLILSGFHEAALMAHACFPYVKPDQKLRFEHTTSSSRIQEKLNI